MNRRELLRMGLLAPFLWMLPKAKPKAPPSSAGMATTKDSLFFLDRDGVYVYEAYDPESEKSYRKIGDGEWEEFFRCPDEPRPLLNRIYYPSPSPLLELSER